MHVERSWYWNRRWAHGSSSATPAAHSRSCWRRVEVSMLPLAQSPGAGATEGLLSCQLPMRGLVLPRLPCLCTSSTARTSSPHCPPRLNPARNPYSGRTIINGENSGVCTLGSYAQRVKTDLWCCFRDATDRDGCFTFSFDFHSSLLTCISTRVSIHRSQPSIPLSTTFLSRSSLCLCVCGRANVCWGGLHADTCTTPLTSNPPYRETLGEKKEYCVQ